MSYSRISEFMATADLKWLSVYILGLCLISFILYGVDKHAAKRSKQRISEKTLLLFDLVGGWPGGLIAQNLFRHKTKKTSYRVKFVLVVILNVTLLVYLFAYEQVVLCLNWISEISS
jgi:uncharacterized membrane protein YsdA (DUF1294 family)